MSENKNMKYKNNWDDTKSKWDGYWKKNNQGRPLMCIVARKDNCNAVEMVSPKSKNDLFDGVSIDKNMRAFCETHNFLAESFPNVSVDLGPGSMAAYLGCDIEVSGGSVWFEEMVGDWNDYKSLEFDPQNPLYQKHLATYRQVVELSRGDYYVGLPDIMDNIDVLASLRGAQETIFDIMDEPEQMHSRIDEVQKIYYRYFDSFYELSKQNEEDIDSSCYTVFQIWGRGKTIKIQCDFSAMMSPNQFEEFIVPALRRVAKGADNVLYHLDGPDAIKHMDALMKIDEIDALQWTSGDYNPDGTFEQWYEIYDKAVAAGKALWIKVYTGSVDEWIKRIDRLVARYGSNAMFLLFPTMSCEDAEKIISHADKNWSDIKSTLHFKL